MSLASQQITLRSGKLQLVVPNAIEDRNIRFLLGRGKNLVDAYTDAGARYILPAGALRTCIELVFKIPYYDPRAGEWKTAAGRFTCTGFHKCFQEYVRAYEVFPETQTGDRRMMIAPGIFTPSWNEEICIVDKFLMQEPLAEAYRQCGAEEIIPRWPGALAFIEKALISSVGKSIPFPPLYEITKRSHQLYALQPPPTPPPAPALSPPVSAPISAPISLPVSPPPEEKKKLPIVKYILIGAGILLLVSDR